MHKQLGKADLRNVCFIQRDETLSAVSLSRGSCNVAAVRAGVDWRETSSSSGQFYLFGYSHEYYADKKKDAA
jgi:hypothetical protein